MIFTRLELYNFGLFQGKHRFDLGPERSGEEQRRNIVLFGGKNGAGKTTILQAVRLCLYGQRSRGARVRRKDYERFLAARIHRPVSPDVVPDGSAVALEFEHVHSGESFAYRVVRRWSIAGDSVDEDLKIFRDGKELTEFDQEHWENFVVELIPPGVSQLFFFDGEKIQALAEEDGQDSELAASIEALLGLDLAERLVSDLSVYIRGHENAGSRKAGEPTKLEELSCRKSGAEDKLHRLKQRRAQGEVRIRSLQKNVQKVEDMISREGGSYARQREGHIARRSSADEELRRIESQIRELAAELLPFALVPKQLVQIEGQLRNDALARRRRAVASLLEDRSDHLRKELARVLGDAREREAEEELIDASEEAVRSVLLEGDVLGEVSQPVHPLSDEASHRLLEVISRATRETPRKVHRLDQELESITRELSRVETALQRAPDEETLRPLLEELGKLHGDLAKTDEEAKALDEQVDLLANEVADLEKKIKREEERLVDSDATDERLRTAVRVQRAVNGFAVRAKAHKVEQLRDHFRNAFSTLSRKDDVIHDVRIDPDTFEVTLYDSAGRGIAKSELSAGEKQVYAIAMLWALAITSGRPLPFLIDTPLGRLDSDHRANIVNRYFPFVAHQVVIFSTDTEIDRPYFDQLKRHIARAYHLRYDGSKNATEVEPGYFWEDLQNERAVESPAA